MPNINTSGPPITNVNNIKLFGVDENDGVGWIFSNSLAHVADAVLRQDLADPDKGAAMVARGVVAVDSIADLLALPEGQRKEGLRYLVKGYHAGGALGGGEFYWDASSTATTDDGLVFSAVGASTGRFLRLVFNHTVSFYDFGCKADGSDETARVQATLNAPYNITSARDQTYTTSATLFNQVPNRTVDFNWSRIRNKTNGRYAIVTVSEALPNQTDTALAAFLAELHYDEQIENSHVKNVLVDMLPNTGGGSNLGIGISYGKDCSIDGFIIENTNGNGYEIRHSYRCRAQNGRVVGARSYGSFNYMTKDCSSVNVRIKGVQRAGIVKHAYYDDPNVNYTFERCVFESVSFNGVAGGSSAETGISPAQQPIGHEIVRGVKVLDCDFITRVGDGRVSSVEPGGHADSWIIEGNRFYSPVGQVVPGFALNIGGERTAGFFMGGQHVLARNKFYGGDYGDAVITNSSSMHAMDNEFHDVQGLKAFNFGGINDGGHTSIRGTKGTFKLLGGGLDVISSGFIAIREGNDSPVISGNTLNITGVANSARKTLAFVVASPLTVAKIHGNNITINLSDPENDSVHAIVAQGGHVSGNSLTVNNSVAGATILGLLGGGVLCGDNDLTLNDTGGAAISTAIRAAAGSIIGTNRYTGWAVDEQILS